MNTSISNRMSLEDKTVVRDGFLARDRKFFERATRYLPKYPENLPAYQNLAELVAEADMWSLYCKHYDLDMEYIPADIEKMQKFVEFDPKQVDYEIEGTDDVIYMGGSHIWDRLLPRTRRMLLKHDIDRGDEEKIYEAIGVLRLKMQIDIFHKLGVDTTKYKDELSSKKRFKDLNVPYMEAGLQEAAEKYKKTAADAKDIHEYKPITDDFDMEAEAERVRSMFEQAENNLQFTPFKSDFKTAFKDKRRKETVSVFKKPHGKLSKKEMEKAATNQAAQKKKRNTNNARKRKQHPKPKSNSKSSNTPDTTHVA